MESVGAVAPRAGQAGPPAALREAGDFERHFLRGARWLLVAHVARGDAALAHRVLLFHALAPGRALAGDARRAS